MVNIKENFFICRTIIKTSIPGYVYEVTGKPINPVAGKFETDTKGGEANGKNKSRFEIANLKPEYNYKIKLYAKTSAGQVMVEN